MTDLRPIIADVASALEIIDWSLKNEISVSYPRARDAREKLERAVGALTVGACAPVAENMPNMTPLMQYSARHAAMQQQAAQRNYAVGIDRKTGELKRYDSISADATMNAWAPEAD